MTLIRLAVNDQRLSLVVTPKLASGDYDCVKITSTFSANWRDYEKTAVFYTSYDKTVYEVLLEENQCVVPHEVLRKAGYLYIGVRGVNPNTQAVRTSTVVKCKVEQGAPTGSTTTAPPTPDVYQQILAKLNNIQVGEVDENMVRAIVAEYLDQNPSGPGTSFTTNHTLSLENGILSVNTTNRMEQDNTLPITSAAVYATVGNIEVLLKTI